MDLSLRAYLNGWKFRWGIAAAAHNVLKVWGAMPTDVTVGLPAVETPTIHVWIW